MLAGFEVVFKLALQIVNIVKVHIGDLFHGGFHVAGQGNVNDQQRPVGALLHNLSNLVVMDHGVRSRGGSYQQVGLLQIELAKEMPVQEVFLFSTKGWGQINNAWTAATSGEKSVQQALDDAQKALLRDIEDYENQ